MVFRESDDVGKLAVWVRRLTLSLPLVPAATHAAASEGAHTHLTNRADYLHKCIEYRTKFKVRCIFSKTFSVLCLLLAATDR